MASHPLDAEATYRPSQRRPLAIGVVPATVRLRPRQPLLPLEPYRLPLRHAPAIGALAPLEPEHIDLHLAQPLPAGLTIEMAVQDDGEDWIAVRTAIQEQPAAGEGSTPDPSGRDDADGDDPEGSFLPETPERPAAVAVAPHRATEESAAVRAQERVARWTPWLSGIAHHHHHSKGEHHHA